MPNLVSVIIPCYNYATYLQRAVNSVVEQSYRNFEAIIVNDGSTDNSLEVARQLKAEHSGIDIKVIDQANSGQPAISRNRGIQESRGDLIICLDADDYFHPEMLQCCVEVFAAEPSIDLVYTDALYRYPDGSTQYWKTGVWELAVVARENQCLYCAMYRRKVWDAYGGYKTNVPGYEDWDFWIGACESGFKARRISKPMLEYTFKDSGLGAASAKRDQLLKLEIAKNHPKLYKTA